ncbi:MAG TPA: ABC transporter ATP-binding protein, partial [Solirubrobacteraceae bacterium]|nr:ABC transporter ATP-binding protein [Solirubrobacteraceae bacterium]
EEVTAGTMRIGGADVTDLAPRHRDIAMVFQNYALYPHMTVRENMAFPLKLAGASKEEIDRKVNEAAEILDLQKHLDRKPANLSGGQRQRVAMGRAIVRDPKAFLMDEPLSNLDAKLRVQMRTEVARIQRQLGTTMIYVTHDQTEAMTLGDRVAVMRAGVLQQVDTPGNLYANPSNLFVAGFIGSPAMNFLPGRVEGGVLRTPLGETALRTEGGDVIVGMRPEHFEDARVEGADVPDRMRFRATADVVESMGSEKYVYFEVKAHEVHTAELDELAADAGMEDLPSRGDGQQVVARLSAESPVTAGDEVELALDVSQIKLFDQSGAAR